MSPTSPEQIQSLLRTSPLLDAFPEEELEELVSNARHLHFDAGETVFAQGTPGTTIYWILKGRVKLTVNSPDGRELLHRMIESGDYCGDITAIDGGLRGVHATAERPSDTVALHRRHLIPAFERHPMAAMKLVRLLCEQIRIAGETLQLLAFHNSETRIWTRLIYLSKQYATVDPESGSMRIDHGLSQQNLADSVSLTRAMVNRQLSAWREHGFIEDGRGFVTILEPEAFESHVWRKVGS